jgi:MtN3 and saliva related transmembrane protein|tara:strand:+ start:99 stop:416 length:318 start_codon:yes stop_codon:yes gene_type:complete
MKDLGVLKNGEFNIFIKIMLLEFLHKYIGFFAAFCTTFAFLPQAIKVWKSKSTKDISLYMFLIFTIGVISWLIYGIFIFNLPIIFANAVTLILSLFILVYKLKYK